MIQYVSYFRENLFQILGQNVYWKQVLSFLSYTYKIYNYNIVIIVSEPNLSASFIGCNLEAHTKHFFVQYKNIMKLNGFLKLISIKVII